MRTGFVVFVACAVIAPMAGAQLTLVSDQRAVLLEAAGTNQAAYPSAPYAPFNLDINLDVPSGGGNGKARGTQNSLVSVSGVSATGTSSADSQAGPANCIFSQATSDFRIEFEVATPVEYAIDGTVDGAQFRLAESIDGVIHLMDSTPGTPAPYSFTGVLKPGRSYLLLAQSSHLTNACTGGSFSLAGSYSLDASFTALAPCPADLNFDRVVDDADFEIFLVGYNEVICPEALPCDADLNSDGLVDDADFEIFLLGYNEVLCP
jgi:hypothetical protein